MHEFKISDGQFHFNRTMKGLKRALIILLLFVVFSPLLVLAYWIDTIFLPLKAPGHVWLLAVLGTGILTYCVLFLFKMLIIGLHRNHSGWWVPLFLVSVALTCILPAVITFPVFNYLTVHTRPVTWVLDIAFAYFVYGQYNFLNQRLPFFPKP